MIVRSIVKHSYNNPNCSITKPCHHLKHKRTLLLWSQKIDKFAKLLAALYKGCLQISDVLDPKAHRELHTTLGRLLIQDIKN